MAAMDALMDFSRPVDVPLFEQVVLVFNNAAHPEVRRGPRRAISADDAHLCGLMGGTPAWAPHPWRAPCLEDCDPCCERVCCPLRFTLTLPALRSCPPPRNGSARGPAPYCTLSWSTRKPGRGWTRCWTAPRTRAPRLWRSRSALPLPWRAGDVAPTSLCVRPCFTCVDLGRHGALPLAAPAA